MSNHKISIIIPFYCVEKYIEKCINSVKAQTFTDFECILIDDESLDNSYEIAKKCIAGDNRFKIIRQKNKGQGGARNTGIENAIGEYLVFLDSDDWWDINFLEVMYNKSILENADIVVCKFRSVNENGNVKGVSNTLKVGNSSSKNELLELFIISPSVCNKIYKKHIWENIRYPENLYYEDLATSFETVLNVEKVTFINDVLYNYLTRKGSTTNHFSRKQTQHKIEAFKTIEKNLKDKKELLIYPYLFHVVYTSCSDLLVHSKNIKENAKQLKELKKMWDVEYFTLKNIFRIRKKTPKFMWINLIAHKIYAPLPIVFFNLKQMIT